MFKMRLQMVVQSTKTKEVSEVSSVDRIRKMKHIKQYKCECGEGFQLLVFSDRPVRDNSERMPRIVKAVDSYIGEVHAHVHNCYVHQIAKFFKKEPCEK